MLKLKPYLLIFSQRLRIFSDFLFLLLLIILFTCHFINNTLDKDISNENFQELSLNFGIFGVIVLLFIHFINFVFFF